MTVIEIAFSFRGVDYKGKVHRIGSGPVQYHLFEVDPELEVKNKIFVWNYETKKLNYGVDPTHKGILEGTIAHAIFDACSSQNIDISKY